MLRWDLLSLECGVELVYRPHSRLGTAYVLKDTSSDEVLKAFLRKLSQP
jgi:hypothetical protein